MVDQAGAGDTTSSPIVQLHRPARALIGWMQPTEGQLWLVSRRQDIAPTVEQIERVARASAAVAARPAGLDQAGAVEDPPAALDQHIAALYGDPAAAGLLNEGWRVMVVDLSKVCAAQPSVHVDHAEERVASVDPGNLASIAAVSLPISASPPTQLPAQFDQVQKAWVFSSANPNLRIVGAGCGVVNGVPMFGFNVALAPSFMRVARYRSRYLLLDGYHRAHGFLRRGITQVPTFVRDLPSFEALGLPQGMLPQDAYLGERPPSLRDYLNDDVAADVDVPTTEKVIVITGLEVQAAA